MDSGEKKILDDVMLADEVLDAVVAQLKIDDDEFHRALVKNMLRRQAKDRIVLAIWKGLSDVQSRALRDFMKGSRADVSWLPEEEILIEFALQYADLKQGIFDELAAFFKDFIVRFNSGGVK